MMGEMADYAWDQWFADGAPTADEDVEQDITTWTTKDGRVFKLVDMTDQHVVNTVRMLAAKLSAHALADTPRDRTRRQIRRWIESATARYHAALSAEAKRRGLEIS